MITKNKIEAIVIGASAGGIEALGKILPALSESFSLPIMVVLHLPPNQPSMLSEIFSYRVKLKVKEAIDQEEIKGGTVYFAQPGKHLVINKDKTLSLTNDSPVLHSRPSIDVLFKTAADVFGKNLAAILLTGANDDGAMGLKKINECGGLTLIQNPASAQLPAMPTSGMPYVKPESILSLDQIVTFLQEINQEPSIPVNSLNNEKIKDKLEVLIVDDVKENLVALKALLKRDDVNISQAMSGSEALELMMKHDFCLALLDIQMPMMNGFELAELMRGTNKTKTIPIIFVTAARDDEKYFFKGYESGAVDFLRKPLDPNALKSKVNVFLELHQQKNELKKQVEMLRETKVELEKAVGIREEFMSIAGHELKTPLTALKLQIQMRLRSLDKNESVPFTPDKLFKIFESDNKQVEKLTRLIDDMLDISRISSGKLSMNLEEFDLCVLIQDIVDRHQNLLKTAGILTEVKLSSDSITGSWDKFRIEQVITNLITNAIRYGAGKPIKISVSADKGRASIVIADTGVGIAEEDLKRIFQRFERATGTETTGLGLGLYIVSQIIEGHKGSIKVESRLGEGSTFKIDLPLFAV